MEFSASPSRSPRLLTLTLAVATLALIASAAHAQLLSSVASDATVFGPGFGDGGGTVTGLTGDLQAGRDGVNYQSAVFVFQLPAFGTVTNPFTDSSFSLTIRNTNSVDAFNGGLNRDLYGLGGRSASDVLGSDFYLGGGDTTDATLIQGGFITGDNTSRFSGNVIRTTDAGGNNNLTNYLNAQYDGGAGAGDYVFLRASLNTTNGNLDGLPIYSGDDAGAAAAFLPQINYTAAVPEPSIYVLALMGLTVVAIVGRRRHGRA